MQAKKRHRVLYGHGQFPVATIDAPPACRNVLTCRCPVASTGGRKRRPARARRVRWRNRTPKLVWWRIKWHILKAYFKLEFLKTTFCKLGKMYRKVLLTHIPMIRNAHAIRDPANSIHRHRAAHAVQLPDIIQILPEIRLLRVVHVPING